MQILACIDCDTPSFTRLPSGETQLRLHFGHTEADIRQAAIQLESAQVEAFVRLWVAPDCPRKFTPAGPGLIISPGE